MSDQTDQTSRSSKGKRSLSDFFSSKRHKSDTASSSSASSSSSSSASSATSPLSSSSSPSSAHHVPGAKQTINNVDSDKDTYSKSFLSVLKQLVDNTEANHEMMEARFDDQDKRITEMGASLGYMSSQINKVLKATKTSSAGVTGAGTSASTSAATSQQQIQSSETETETYSGFVWPLGQTYLAP
jgi:hypothetical protein